MNKEQKDLEGNDALIVKETVVIDDGLHNGHITNMVSETRKEFHYIDVYVELDDVKGKETGDAVTIKTGFPAGISEKSSFGKFLFSSGMEFKAGDSLSLKDIKDRLFERTISFQTMTDGDFSNIINKTIKFLD